MLITNAFLKFHHSGPLALAVKLSSVIWVSLNCVLVFLYDRLELYIGHNVSVHQDEVALYDRLRIYLAQRVSDR